MKLDQQKIIKADHVIELVDNEYKNKSTSCASFGADEKSFLSWINATAANIINVIAAQNTIVRNIVKSI